MKKIYQYKKTKELIKQLKPFLLAIESVEQQYSKDIRKIEEEIEEITGIPEIELIFCDNEIVGVGNAERTMELIHRREIENG
jgi:hypothetical protein